ncbi:hypothetical protein Daus18300_003542 [Diaporthe australafricana]|uniref:Oxidoreductase acuF-like C2H2 type zinc-finger domain-containing protein n=1 Tax=Diaporthe australafricana TaxID=127596 RepID=A0ABR3XEZ5_9PEZI
MGLFVAGHGSLDYRVREAERLAQTIRRFMQDLINSLDDVLQMCSGASQSGASGMAQTCEECSEPEATGDDEEHEHKDEDEDEEGLDMEVLLDGTGVDFLQAIKGADLDYVKSVFLEYQKIRARQESNPVEVKGGPSGENEDEVWEPIRTVLIQERGRDKTGANSYLIDHIAQANFRRRQQFAYWAKHRDKLHNHTRAYQAQQGQLQTAQRHKSSEFPSLLEMTPGALPSVTTATNLNIARLDAMDNRSSWTISEYVPSTRQAAGDSIEFPPAPKIQSMAPTAKFFECPYCFFLCPNQVLADKAWKAHLIHDMRPYICTYEDCRNPGQLYDSRQDWVQHENSEHRKIWRCLEHSDLVFRRLETYKCHLQEQHAVAISGEASLNRIIQASESASAVVDRACPICTTALNTIRAMEGHIALHLERFARFSMPRSVVNDIDDSSADSGKANKVDEEGSRDHDFEDDYKLHSDMADSETQLTGHSPRVDTSNPLRGVGSTEGELQTFDSQSFENDEDLDSESGRDHQAIQQRTEEEAKSDHFISGEWCADPEKYEEAENSYREALEQNETALGHEHLDTLTSMSSLAHLLLGQRKSEEAEQMYRKVLELREKISGQEDPEILETMNRLGIALSNQGKYIETEQVNREVLDLRMKALGREHPATLTSMSNLALSLYNLGRLEEAKKLCVEVIKTRKHILGPAHPDTLISMSNLASTLQSLGQWEEAEKLCVEVMETRKQILGSAHPHMLISMSNLASIFHTLGRWEEAEKLCMEVIETRKQILGPAHPYTLDSRAILALAFREQGRLKEADELEVEVMETRKQKIGSAHPRTLDSMDDLAHTWYSLGRTADAIALMASCARLRGEVLGPENPETTLCIENLDAWRAEGVPR